VEKNDFMFLFFADFPAPRIERMSEWPAAAGYEKRKPEMAPKKET
jgi:hypothetical protein